MSNMVDFVLYTVNARGVTETMPQTSWPRVLEDAAEDFFGYPSIIELWLCNIIRVDADDPDDRVLLWSRK
jgi:hypothetical protein